MIQLKTNLLVVGGIGENFDRFQIRAIYKERTVFEIDTKTINSLVFRL
jgi:hypothetical protein